MNANATLPPPERDLGSEKNLTTVVYALQAVSFFVGITYIVAALINHLKRPAVAGTWLESHFRWQINTFWYSLLWGLVGGLTLFWGIGYMILIADTLWIVYRIVQGWVCLDQNKPMYGERSAPLN